MTTDLYLITYRRQELELSRRLERRRVAQERADQAAPTGRRGAPATGGLRSRAEASLARVRHTVGGAAAPTGCCAPA